MILVHYNNGGAVDAFLEDYTEKQKADLAEFEYVEVDRQIAKDKDNNPLKTFEKFFFFVGENPAYPLIYYQEPKIAEIKEVIEQQEHKAQRSSQEITEALLLNQSASQADIDAFTALHSAKKINQAKLLEVANATNKEQVEAIQVVQVEYKNGTWLEL